MNMRSVNACLKGKRTLLLARSFVNCCYSYSSYWPCPSLRLLSIHRFPFSQVFLVQLVLGQHWLG